MKSGRRGSRSKSGSCVTTFASEDGQNPSSHLGKNERVEGDRLRRESQKRLSRISEERSGDEPFHTARRPPWIRIYADSKKERTDLNDRVKPIEQRRLEWELQRRREGFKAPVDCIVIGMSDKRLNWEEIRDSPCVIILSSHRRPHRKNFTTEICSAYLVRDLPDPLLEIALSIPFCRGEGCSFW